MTKAQGQFAAAIEGASLLTGFNKRQIILGEAGVILKTCASRTKVAKNEVVVKGARLRVLRGLGLTRGGPITVNAGIRGDYGGVFIRKKDGNGYRRSHHANFVPVADRHFTDDQWAAIQSAIETTQKLMPRGVNEAKLSAGLGRGSWVLIADSLGITLESVSGGGSISPGAITKARDSRARGNKQRNNGLSRVEQTQEKFFVTLINRLPYGRTIGLDRLLSTVMIGRAKYFFMSVEKGFTGSLQQTFARFPEWTVRTR